MPLRGKVGAQTNPGKVMKSGNTSQETCSEAAGKYQISPQTLWGIYGTESADGTNDGPSSAGAEGPMQFIPPTAQRYGLTTGATGTVQQLKPAMFASARYLHDLGADTNPKSAKTIAAVNGYNGNGGGSSPETSYAKSVLEKGSTFGGSSPQDIPEKSGEPSSSGGSGGGSEGSPSVLSLLDDLVTGNVAALGGQLAIMSLHIVKGVAVGFADLIVAPAWHWDQRAAAYYASFVLNPKRIADGSEYQWAFAWNAVFWGVGYALLFTEPETKSLKPAPVTRTRLAHHARKIQAIPARRSLIKPKHVKQRTPQKPKPRVSKATVTLQHTYTTTRTRQVKIHGSDGNTQNTTSSIPVQRAETITEPDTTDTNGTGAPSAQRRDTQNAPTQGAGEGNRA